jgi:hypothetical protein
MSTSPPKGVVKVKDRQVSRLLKSGERKTYSFVESNVLIEKDHGYIDGTEVVVLDKEKYFNDLSEQEQKVREIVEHSAMSLKELKKSHEKELDDLEHTHNLMTNKYHAQEKRLEKAFNEINDLEEEVRKLEARGILDIFRKKLRRPELNK